MAAMGRATDSASDRVQQLSVKFDNLKASMGVGLQTAALSFYDLFDQLFKDLSLGFEGMIQAMVQSSGVISARRIATLASQGFEAQNVGATEPNLPPGPPVLNFGNFSVQTLSNMKERLAAFNAELENTQIGSARFKELTKVIEKLGEAIDKAMGKTWSGAKQTIIDLDTKGIKPMTHSLASQNMVLQATVIPTYDKWGKMIKGAQAQLALLEQQLNSAAAFGAMFGGVLTGAFNAAMVNGTTFFDEIGNAIKNFVQQMAAALATTAALAILFSAITGTSLKTSFVGISKATGLGGFFGEDGMFNMNATVKGSDLNLSTGRGNTNYGRSGG
jgi:hypothetical protein